MRSKIIIGFSALAWVGLLTMVVRAQQPTSRVIPFNNVATTIPASTPGQALTIQLWDAAATPPGTLLFSEAQTLDVDASGNISFVFGSRTENGLDPANFPSGSSRFLDVVDSTNTSVLPSPPGRIPLNAVAFALSPGPAGPAGPQGPPGPISDVTGNAPIAVTSPTTTTRNVALNPITHANIAAGAAIAPAKIAGTAATLGANNFTGNQSIAGNLSVNGTGSLGLNTTGGGLQVQPNASSPNLIGGFSGNNVAAGVTGATIGGGGLANGANSLTANFGTVGGGQDNTASGSFDATVPGGRRRCHHD